MCPPVPQKYVLCILFSNGWWGSCGRRSKHSVQRPVKQNASPGEQSEAARPRRKPGQEQNPGPENQDSQHMLEQPGGHFPEYGPSGQGLRRCCPYQDALKGTNLRGQTEPKRRFSLIFTDFCRFSPFPRKQSIWETQIFAESRWIFAGFSHKKTADWRLSP